MYDGIRPNNTVWDVYGGYSKNEWTKCDTHWTACVGDSENATEIQILQMTVKDMKEMLGVRSQDDIDVFKLCPYNYNRPEVKLLSVKLYAADYDGDYDSGNNDPKKPKVDKVRKKMCLVTVTRISYSLHRMKVIPRASRSSNCMCNLQV